MADPVLCHTPQYLSPEEANLRFEECLAQIPFHTIMWRTGRNLPRQVFRYDVGGSDNIRVLDALINRVETESGRKIMGVFCNRYRDGNDHTPFHKDTYGCDVFTLSLGATRSCVFKPDNGGTNFICTLKSGDLLYFNQATNAIFKHSIPQERNVGERVSLVFFAE